MVKRIMLLRSPGTKFYQKQGAIIGGNKDQPYSLKTRQPEHIFIGKWYGGGGQCQITLGKGTIALVITSNLIDRGKVKHCTYLKMQTATGDGSHR